jgi:colanic acid biosynthesis glycosyl transferase WcaI
LRLLLLNQPFYPDHVATAQHLADLAAGLAAHHDVTVVASNRAYDDPRRRFAAREVWKGIKIHRVGSAGLGKGAKWKRAIDFGTFIIAACLRLATLKRPDIVVALTSPPLISFIGACLAAMRRGKFVYWVMDLNPDEAIAAGWLAKTAPLTRLLEAMSRFSLRRADRVIVLDRFMRDLVLAKGISSAKIVVIPPWSHDDAVRFDPAGRNEFRKTHGLEGKFVTMYSGNHSPCHPLDTLLEAANALRNEPAFAFCFVGGGSEFTKVKRFAAQHNLTNILCLPYQPLEQLAGSLSAADLHTVVMGNSFVGTIHPCKIYNILAVGAPVLYIGPETSHVTELALDPQWPFISVRHGDAHRLVDELRRLVPVVTRPDARMIERTGAAFSKETLLPRIIREIELLLPGSTTPSTARRFETTDA